MNLNLIWFIEKRPSLVLGYAFEFGNFTGPTKMHLTISKFAKLKGLPWLCLWSRCPGSPSLMRDLWSGSAALMWLCVRLHIVMSKVIVCFLNWESGLVQFIARVVVYNEGMHGFYLITMNPMYLANTSHSIYLLTSGGSRGLGGLQPPLWLKIGRRLWYKLAQFVFK